MVLIQLAVLPLFIEQYMLEYYFTLDIGFIETHITCNEN